MESMSFENGEPVWSTPVVEVQMGDEVYQFTYLNTRIRLFGDRWAHLNHVEYRHDSGDLQGIRVTQGFMDSLMEHDYPYQFDPIPDASTEDWYVRAETKTLEEDLGSL